MDSQRKPLWAAVVKAWWLEEEWMIAGWVQGQRQGDDEVRSDHEGEREGACYG